jgi:hypothetical protein
MRHGVAQTALGAAHQDKPVLPTICHGHISRDVHPPISHTQIFKGNASTSNAAALLLSS